MPSFSAISRLILNSESVPGLAAQVCGLILMAQDDTALAVALVMLGARQGRLWQGRRTKAHL